MKESTHYSISVPRVKLEKLKIPKSVHFETGIFYDYNSNYDSIFGESNYKDIRINDTQGKLNFLYTALLDKYEENIRRLKGYLKYIEKVLKENGCQEVSFEDTTNQYNEVKKPSWVFLRNDIVYYSIYTDKMDDKLFSELIYNTRRLLSFLFSEKSVVNIQVDLLGERVDIGPEKNTEKIFYGWTWFC